MKMIYLSYLLEVAKCQSINKASANLVMNQQQLSKVIRLIEEDFGTKIFDRTSRGVTVTANGAEILTQAQNILQIYTGLQDKFKPSTSDQQASKGKLTIYATENLWDTYSAIMNEFSLAFPQVSLEFIRKSTEEIIDLVGKTPVSVGLITQIEQNKEPDYDIPPNISFHAAYEASVVAYTAINSEFCKKYKSLTLKTLFSLPLISLVSSAFDDALNQNLFKNIGLPNLKYVVSDKKSFFELLGQGHCLTLGIGQKSQELLETKGVVPIPIRDKIKFIPALVCDQANLTNHLVHNFTSRYAQYYKNY